MDTRIVTIDLGLRSYDIYIGSGLLYRIADYVPYELAGRSVFLVADENTAPYMQTLQVALKEAGAARTECFVVTPGEQTKSFTSLERLTNWLLESGIRRDSIVFAVGGGVVGDLTGFAASVAMRGVPYIQIPTSLLAQVDSSVGGKTGINTAQGKNLVGSFYQPKAVVIDIDTLGTLPKRELLAGYAEIAKYGLINDSGFFSWLDDHGENVCRLDEEELVHAIESSVKAKALVVQADEKEQGQRALLNLGHTFGHALEAAAGYDGRLLHGEAVSIGAVLAYDLSHRMGLCTAEDLERVRTHFSELGLPTQISFIDPALDTTPEALIEAMGHDKKVSGGKINFILVNGIGEAFMSDEVDLALVKAVLKDSLGEQQGKASSDSENGLSMSGKFKNKGVKGLWRSAFSSRA